MIKLKAPPPLCHPDRPYHCKGLCKQCYHKKYREEHSEELRLANELAYYSNRQKYIDYVKARRVRLGKNDDSRFFSYLRGKGIAITKQDYYKLTEDCGNTCQICGRPPYENKRLHLDHCHKTGKVRGLLCARCNWYLATVENNPEILDKIKTYLSL